MRENDNTPCAGKPPKLSYPLETPNDRRFTYKLVFDVIVVLVKHGYPQPFGEEILDLEKALCEFLYDPVFANRQWRIHQPVNDDDGQGVR